MFLDLELKFYNDLEIFKVLPVISTTDSAWQDSIKQYIENNINGNILFLFPVEIKNSISDYRYGFVLGYGADKYNYCVTFYCAFSEINSEAIRVNYLSLIQGIQFGWVNPHL